ncbi:5-formyltetrahydrofolate cyclo-ligase [bacterium F11]|nr:5-formyltetrahydrofolate cyclo-ligase [bacterium F11]
MNPSQLREAKNWLRSHLVALRKNQKMPNRLKANLSIARQVVGSKMFREANVIATYLQFGSEVSTNTIIEQAWLKGKTVVIPNTQKGFGQTFFTSYCPGDSLKKTSYGPLEKVKSDERIPSRRIDLNLVPGLAFDRSGFRLGYGGGVYDRLISQTRNAVQIGLFFSFQELFSVPRARFDQKLDVILTEKGLIQPKIMRQNRPRF